MIVKRKSPHTGTINEMELDVTQEQINEYHSGDLMIQHAFPKLTREEREFIKTGLTAADWEDIYGPEI